MAQSSNPFEVARETLRRLAAQRTPPTPDNYLRLYHEIAGTQAALSNFPEPQLRSLNMALGNEMAEHPRLARRLDDSLKQHDWESYQQAIVAHIRSLSAAQKLPWHELITDLVQQCELRQGTLSPARKQEALEHALLTGGNPEALYKRLRALIDTWADSAQAAETFPAGGVTSTTPPSARSTRLDEHILPQLRELFAFTLEHAITPQLLEQPAVRKEAQTLVHAIRTAHGIDQLEDLLTRLKRFAFRLQLLSEEQNELRDSLLNLLRLLINNASELVLDDEWLHGQVAIVRDIIDRPLSQRSLDDAESRLTELIFKQSQLKAGLHDAREAIKQMLSGFVAHLGRFADSTADYHAILDDCANRIAGARDLTQLEASLAQVIKETRKIQLNAHRARDELKQTEQSLRAAENRIRALEKQLAASSERIHHDQLTGLLNQHGLNDLFTKEIARARRHASSLCLALLDIDNFRALQTTHGQEGTDAALMHLTRICRSMLRPQDALARHSEEEFIILLPDTDLEEATRALTRMQRELTKHFFLHGNEKILITFSAGVSAMIAGVTLQSALARAHGVLQQAKRSGKNQVCATPE